MSLGWVFVFPLLASQVLTRPLQDTFVVGCKFSDKCIYPETFENNADADHPVYSTEYGIYEPHCGLDNVMLTWGHDEVCFLFCGSVLSTQLSSSISTTFLRTSVPFLLRASP